MEGIITFHLPLTHLSSLPSPPLPFQLSLSAPLLPPCPFSLIQLGRVWYQMHFGATVVVFIKVLEAHHVRCLQSILGIRWWHRNTHT